MSEQTLYVAYHTAHAAYLADPTADKATAWLSAFEDFAAVYIEDDVARHEEIEELRRTLTSLHPEPQAERIVPRWA